MRICSLLPSATEIVYALGLGDNLVGVSYACDHPEEATAKPIVSHSLRQMTDLDSGEIDALVQQARANRNPMYWIDEELLRELQPDLIITQELCEVCAISSGSVFETAAKVLDYQPDILTIRPNTLADILSNIGNIGTAAGAPHRSDDLVSNLKRRVERVRCGVDGARARPRVLCLDWLDPLRNTGQWLPELVELAGGEEGLAVKGGPSRELGWGEISAYGPEYLMVMPCAFGPERGRAEALEKLPGYAGWESIPAVVEGRVLLFDGRVPSRHGPRVVDVLEGLAEAMHPKEFDGLAPDGIFDKRSMV